MLQTPKLDTLDAPPLRWGMQNAIWYSYILDSLPLFSEVTDFLPPSLEIVVKLIPNVTIRAVVSEAFGT